MVAWIMVNPHGEPCIAATACLWRFYKYLEKCLLKVVKQSGYINAYTI